MSPETDLVTKLFGFAYSILDLHVLSAGFLGLAVFPKGNIGKSRAPISAAILMTTWADVIFSYAALQETYYNGHPVDLLYTVSYVFFILAFLVHVEEL
jgi:hypothetical protein